jgi:hypothetical protein
MFAALWSALAVDDLAQEALYFLTTWTWGGG